MLRIAFPSLDKFIQSADIESATVFAPASSVMPFTPASGVVPSPPGLQANIRSPAGRSGV
ncbi:MAG: hypothetical protein AB7W16_28945 [Candidatus Obscuribacterales bacterium]